MSIDYQAIAKAGGIGKGPSKRKLKAKKDREDAQQLKWFRDRVWLRESTPGDAFIGALAGVQAARCQSCGVLVMRGGERPMTGEVHHRIFRGNKATRYDPNNGVLLCNHLVNNCHEKAERKLIQV